MKKPTITHETVHGLVSANTVSLGITAYNAGSTVLPTLESLWHGMSELGLTSMPLILSESFDQSHVSSAKPASDWARQVGAALTIESSDRRRSLKEALNVIFSWADSDVLILVVDDVVVPDLSLAAMIYWLFADPRPMAVMGATLPDPAYQGFRRKAGAWQLRAVTRAASLSARTISANSFRAEGAFWGAWRDFYRSHKLQVGTGSIHDDVQTTRALISRKLLSYNVPEACVYKVPPGTLRDFCSTTLRSKSAAPGHIRGPNELAAAAIEAVKDPLGAVLYALARVWCLVNRSRYAQPLSDVWQVTRTTKRS